MFKAGVDFEVLNLMLIWVDVATTRFELLSGSCLGGLAVRWQPCMEKGGM